MSRRGILYITWGDKLNQVHQRSIDSVARHHGELPIHVARLPQKATLLEKSRMLDMTPFEETLYLDVDTVVLGRLDFGFKKAVRHGLVCAICECPWARRYTDLSGDIVEYNTGVLFFTAKARPVFDAWKKLAFTVDSSIPFFVDDRLVQMPLNDQAGFALAVEQSGFTPFVLPYNWNFRPQWHKSFFGPIKVWHDYREVYPGLLVWNKNQLDERQIIQYNEVMTPVSAIPENSG